MIERSQRSGRSDAQVDVRARARCFDEALERARRGMAQASAPKAQAAARKAKQPGEVLARRRGVADGKDARLGDRREEQERAGEGERRLCAESREAARPAGAPTPPREAAAARAPAPVSLAAAVEKLALAVERRDRADPSLTMRFGEGLSMSLARGGRGLELSITGDRAAARSARADLPALLSKLRERGIEVARAEVRALTAGGGSARTGLLQAEGHGTVAKW